MWQVIKFLLGNNPKGKNSPQETPLENNEQIGQVKNYVAITGNSNKTYQDIRDSTITDKSVTNIYYPPSIYIPRSKYLNTFAYYELANLVGREPQLKAIEEHLQQRHLLLLHGIGGIGKTTLAKAYISQAHEKYNHVAYVEIAGSIADSMLIQLGDSPDVDLVVDSRFDPEAKFGALIDTLRHIPKLLLILDNANDADDLRERKQQLSSLNATVLITGRARPQSFVQERNVQEIKHLTPNEALQLFRHHYTSALTEAEHVLIERMLKEAFYHPKLIEVIAKSAQANAFLSLEELTKIVGKKHYEEEEINYPIEIDDQTKKIYRVLLDLFDTDPLSKDAQQLLRYFAIVPSVDIPVQDLATLLQIKSTDNQQVLLGNLNSLVHTGWLEELDNRFFSMHGLVQWVIRQRLTPTAANCAPLILGMQNALHYEQTENPLNKRHYLTYSIEWLSLFHEDMDEDLAHAFARIASLYGALGDHQQQLIYTQKALAIRETVLPANHLHLARSYSNLASAYGALGNPQKRLEYSLKALFIRRSALPADHPSLAHSYNNLAIAYGDLGDYQQQLVCNQKALTIREALLPTDHLHLARSYNNLAVTYGDLKDYQQQLIYNQKALIIYESVLPPDHPDLARSYGNLAVAYGNLGDDQQQLAYNQKALAIREAVLPANHPDLANSYNNLGFIFYESGDLEQALYFLKKALVIYKQTFTDEHSTFNNIQKSVLYIEQVIKNRNNNVYRAFAQQVMAWILGIANSCRK